jgi:flagellar secretion chaperone FliS
MAQTQEPFDMFSSGQTLGSRPLSATVYREVGARTALDGASPHKLVSLLYSALATQIAGARGALARRDVAAKGRAISHAVRIVEEGLRAPLDLQAGGAIAANLDDLYDYLIRQLTLANVKNDEGVLGECARLVETLREGWDGIAAQADTAGRVAA